MKAGFDLWMLGAAAGTVMTLRMAVSWPEAAQERRKRI